MHSCVLLIVCEPRADVRVRVRRIVVRVRVRHAAIRVRIVVRPIDHPAYGGFRLSRYKNIKFIAKKPNFVILKIFSSGLRHFQYPASFDAG